MKKELIIGFALVFATVLSAAEITLTQKDEILTVKNQFYQAVFDGNKGYSMPDLTVAGRKLEARGGLVFSTDGENEKYIEGFYSSTPLKFNQSGAKDVKCQVLEKGPQKAVFRLEWNLSAGKAIDTVTCIAESPLIRHDVEFDFNRVMSGASYQLSVPNFAEDGSMFYPDRRRVPGVWGNGFYSSCPTWKFAWNPGRKAGLGLIAPQGQDFECIHYFMHPNIARWSAFLVGMELQHKPLRYIKVPGKVNFSFYVIAGGDPDLAAKLAAAELPNPKDITLDEVWPQKLITRKGEDNFTTIKIANHAGSAKEVKLVSKILWNVNEEKTVDTRKIDLQPGETRELQINWQGAPMEWGITFRTEAYLDDKLIDGKEEYCAISDFPPAVAGVSIVNAGQCNQKGAETDATGAEAACWIEKFRRGYIGVFEFYVWTPSTIGGLTPEEEKWEPHTESQGSYRTTLTKSFLKTLINEAHTNGVYVYAMITGLFNYRKGLENPKLFQYCPDGQPNIYNGKVYDGNIRFATGKANAYDEEFAYKWGQEMGRSVDMFGWDGCRWDWNFIPNAPNDPLFTSMAGELPDWYDWRGIPSKELYSDPDATAMKALKAWRRGVEEKHPKFVYGTNGGAREETFRKYPRYKDTETTKSLMLFEYLLGYASESYNTWQKWAKNLTEACQRVRKNGAQSIVGSMRGLLPGTVSLNLANYVCVASGVKWWEGPAVPDGIDQSYKCYRFMVRFSEYYFDPEFVLMPDARRSGEVKVTGSPRIFWEQFVYERNKDGFRDVTVHLINLPESDYICQRHEIPPVRENVEIAVKPQAGEKLAEAWAMLPNPYPHAIKLKASGAAAVLPELKDAAIVLFKFKK